MKITFNTISGSNDKELDVSNASNVLAVFTTPESYGAIGDGIADDTLALSQAHNSGLNVIYGKNKTYKVTKTGVIPLKEGCVYDGNGSTIVISPTLTQALQDLDGFFGRWKNYVFYRAEATAMQKDIVVKNFNVDMQRLKVTFIGANDTAAVRDNHLGNFIVTDCKMQGIGETPGRGAYNDIAETWIESEHGSFVYVNGYKLFVERCIAKNVGHAIIAFNGKKLLCRDVETYYCGVSADHTTWCNTSSIVARGTETIDVDGCYSYITGGTTYHLAADQAYKAKRCSVRHSTLVGCGLSAIGSGTRSYSPVASQYELIEFKVEVLGFCCAPNATKHGGVRIGLEDPNSSTCQTAIIDSHVNYLAPWETWNSTNKDVDGSFNTLKKKGSDVGNQSAMYVYGGTNGKMDSVTVKGDILNHQKLGLVAVNMKQINVELNVLNTGWSKNSSGDVFDSQQSIYVENVEHAIIKGVIRSNCAGANKSEPYASAVLLKDFGLVELDVTNTDKGLQLYPVRLVQTAKAGILRVKQIYTDSPYKNGGFTYLIDMYAGGTFNKQTTIYSDMSIAGFCTGSRDISPFTSHVKVPTTTFGNLTCSLFSAKCYDGRVIEFITRDSFTLTLTVLSGSSETIDGATSLTIPASSKVRLLSINGNFVTV